MHVPEETDLEFTRHFLQLPEERRGNLFHVAGLHVDEPAAFPHLPVVLPLACQHPRQLYLLQLLNIHTRPVYLHISIHIQCTCTYISTHIQCTCTSVHTSNALVHQYTCPVYLYISTHVQCTCTSVHTSSVLVHQYTCPMYLYISTHVQCACTSELYSRLDTSMTSRCISMNFFNGLVNKSC